MARPLHNKADMIANPNRWRRLNPAMVADLPEEGGVFEVANLVRNVHLIAAAEGNLRARLESVMGPNSTLPPSPGGYYFRYEPATAEKDALARHLASYQAAHRGTLPACNRGTTRTLRLAPRRAA
jgi:hypothetical protein